MMRTVLLALAATLSLATAVLAVEPDEILSDPALELRARELSKGLRCLVCRNENIDDSHAALARDLRLLVRERLVSGDTDAQAIAYIVERYGEYVLLNPPANGTTLILWLAGPGLLLLGGGLAFAYTRTRSRGPQIPDVLTDQDKARIAELTKG